jgi:hypothetical protein
MERQTSAEQKAKHIATPPEEKKIRRQENANMEAMMKIHARIESIVKDKATAEALKPSDAPDVRPILNDYSNDDG